MAKHRTAPSTPEPQVDPPTDSHETGSQVAMSNGSDVVKSVADWIAPSNNDHGVHAALVKFGLCD